MRPKMAFLDLTQLSKVRKSQPQGLSLSSPDCGRTVGVEAASREGGWWAPHSLREAGGNLASSGLTARVGASAVSPQGLSC